MPSTLTRKQFLTLAIVTLGVGCGSDDSEDKGGSGGGSGTGGSGTGGSGTGGSGTGGSGTGGSGTGGSGTGGSGTGGSGTGGSSGSGTGGGASGGAAGSGGGTSNACTGAIAAVIFANHGHALSIPLADIEAGTEKTYQTTGANHCHQVTLTAADFATLKSGGVVTKQSCNGTNHQYVLGCANPPAPAAPSCNADPNEGACN